MTLPPRDVIAAIATPPGNGGVGVVRISGADLRPIINALLPPHHSLKPRTAHLTRFLAADQSVLDEGIALLFPAPHSYTGEHVLELQGHGGSVILDLVLQRVLALGARLARPGEFSERAFLNGKLDLAQAEAVADLIESSTEQSARSAMRSLQGVFSQRIQSLLDELIQLRVYVEAALDFSDEDIDFIAEGAIEQRLQTLAHTLESILETARQGRLLRDGMTVVLAGKPNAGKSSLLNQLAGHEAAIVTEIAGTTRDILRERIQLDGMPLHIIDTAGLRDSDNAVEQEGVRRARQAIEQADRILWLIDSCEPENPEDTWMQALPEHIPVSTLYNKIDLTGAEPRLLESNAGSALHLSIKTGAGLDLLKQHLKHCMGYRDTSEDVFIARRRHIEALQHTRTALEQAGMQLRTTGAAELIAEELRQAQQSLGQITGAFSSDDLLGEIFSSFCIGK